MNIEHIFYFSVEFQHIMIALCYISQLSQGVFNTGLFGHAG